jgi:hypothetical protein
MGVLGTGTTHSIPDCEVVDSLANLNDATRERVSQWLGCRVASPIDRFFCLPESLFFYQFYPPLEFLWIGQHLSEDGRTALLDDARFGAG